MPSTPLPAEEGGRDPHAWNRTIQQMNDRPASVVGDASEGEARKTMWQNGPDGYNEVYVGDASDDIAWTDGQLKELEYYYARAGFNPHGVLNPAMAEVLAAVPSLIRSLRSTRAALEEARRGVQFYSDELGRVSGLLMQIDPTDRFASCSEHLESLLPRFVREAARSASPVQTPTENGK